MNVVRFLVQNHTQVLELTAEHLWLVGISTAAGDADRHTAGDPDRPPSAIE